MSEFIERLKLNYRTSRLSRVLWYVTAVCVVLLILDLLFIAYLNKRYPKEYIESQFAPLKEKYGIKVIYEIDDNFFSPLEVSLIPVGPSKNSKVKPIAHRALLKYPAILQKAFEKYPAGIIEKYLKAIHFAGEINENGFRAAGSYDPFRHVIFLVNNGWKDDIRAEKTFHHEFSSLLLKSRSLVTNPWLEQNPPDFEYKHLDKVPKDIFDEKDENFKKGFLNKYAFTCFENDFNEFSGMIFTRPEKFRQIMDKYPRIRGKFLVWLKFYQDIDTRFTEEYFFGQKI